MKKIYVLIAMVLLFHFYPINIWAQNVEDKIGSNYFGINFGAGYINPKRINERLENIYNGQSNIHLAWNLEFNAGYFVTEQIELKGAVVGAVAFSVIEGTDMIGMANNHYNTFTRLAPEVLANYHIPLGYYNTFYAGGGISYNFLSLSIYEDQQYHEGATSDSMPGLRFNMGILSQRSKHKIYYELKANLIKDSRNYLNFSGVALNIGSRF
jgi:hypothetical protein